LFVAMLHSLHSVTNKEQHKQFLCRSLQKTSECMTQYYMLKSKVAIMLCFSYASPITQRDKQRTVQSNLNTVDTENTGRKHSIA